MAKKTARVRIDQRGLAALGIGAEEFQAALQLLTDVFGKHYARELTAKGHLRVQDLAIVCRHAHLVKALRGCAGITRVVKLIREEHKGNIHGAAGQWFQLAAGYCLQRVGETPVFEVPVLGVPRDISLRADSVLLECKCFLLPVIVKGIYRLHEATFRKIKRVCPTGIWWVDTDSSDVRSFEGNVVRAFEQRKNAPARSPFGDMRIHDRSGVSTHPMECVPESFENFHAQVQIKEKPSPNEHQPASIVTDARSYRDEHGLTVHFSGPRLELIRRIESVLNEKYGQMAASKCNLMVLDLSMHIGDILQLVARLDEILASREYGRLSALLCTTSEYSGIAGTTTVRLVRNPHAEVALPLDLLDRLVDRTVTIA